MDGGYIGGCETKHVLLAVVVVILLWVVYSNWSMIATSLGLKSAEHLGCSCGKTGCNCSSEKMKPRKSMPLVIKEHAPKAEYLADPEDNLENDAEVLSELGYNDGAGWSDVLAATELDASVHDNQREFVADVRRFSSGANFTAVTDDNTNIAFTNFTGLRRPQHVHIGDDARQQPDIDQTVLQRNRDLRW